MQDRLQAVRLNRDQRSGRAEAVLIAARPAIRSRYHPYPIRPQHMDFARGVLPISHEVQIGIPEEQEMREHTIEQGNPALARVRPLQQAFERVVRHLRPLHRQRERHIGRRLRDEPHAAMHHRIAMEPGAHQRNSPGLAKQPATGMVEGQHGEARLAFGRAHLRPRLRPRRRERNDVMKASGARKSAQLAHARGGAIVL